MITPSDRREIEYVIYKLNEPYFVNTPGDQNEVDLATGQAIVMTYSLKLAKEVNSTEFTKNMALLVNALLGLAATSDPSLGIAATLPAKDIMASVDNLKITLARIKDPTEPGLLDFKNRLPSLIEKASSIANRYYKKEEDPELLDKKEPDTRGTPTSVIVASVIGLGVVGAMIYLYSKET